MQVGMVRQVLPPGVQDCQKPDLGSQMPGIGRHREQRLGRRTKQQVVQLPFVLKDNRRQRFRQGEDDVEILDRQQVCPLCFQPFRSRGGLAFGTVAITAGVIDRLLMAAAVADFQVSTEGRRPAGRQSAQDASLRKRHQLAAFTEEIVLISADHVAHFESRPATGGTNCRISLASGSSRLAAFWIRSTLTCVYRAVVRRWLCPRIC